MGDWHRTIMTEPTPPGPEKHRKAEIDQIGAFGIHGAQGRNRTVDTRIFSPLLYRLSYLGIVEELLTKRKVCWAVSGWCPVVETRIFSHML